MNWAFLVKAAFAILSTVSDASLGLLHGGALHTAESVNSAVKVANAFANGVANQLTAADVHPDLAAHAAVLQEAAR